MPLRILGTEVKALNVLLLDYRLLQENRRQMSETPALHYNILY